MNNQAQINPLTPAVFYILLALAIKDSHGYEIMKQVQKDSEARVKMGPGTLYGSIQRMLDQNLIEEVQPEGKIPRRRYYRITRNGKKILQAEIERYESTTKMIKQRKLGLNTFDYAH